MNSPVIGLPGVGAALQALPREIFAGNVQLAQFVPGVHVIDGSKSRNPLNTGQVDVLWAGMLMGQITATRKFAPSVLGVTTQAYAAAATTLNVSPAVAAEVSRRIGSSGTNQLKLIGPPTAGGVVATQLVSHSAVNAGTGAITITGLAAAAVLGSLLCPADGSETIKTLLANRWGVKVTDYTGINNVDVLEEHLLLAAHVRTSNIVNYPLDTSLAAYVKSSLRAFAPAMTFDDDWV